jgi:hypothetical protein
MKREDALSHLAKRADAREAGVLMPTPPSSKNTQPMPCGPKGEKRPADVIGNAAASCGSTREIEKTRRAKKFKLTHYPAPGTFDHMLTRTREDWTFSKPFKWVH